MCQSRVHLAQDDMVRPSFVHTDPDQTKAFPGVDATLLVPPASSNPAALLGEIK